MKKWILIVAFLFLPGLAWADGAVVVMSGATNSEQGGATDYTADANCQGAWLFADNLNDSSGEGNTLEAGDASTYTTDRPTGYTTGKSMDLDGTDDYFYVQSGNLSANFPGKAQKTDFSFGLWFYHDAADTDDGLIRMTGALNVVWDWIVDGNDDFGIYVKDSDAHSDWANPHSGYMQNTWTHVVFSFDGSEHTGTVWLSQGTFGSLINGTGYTYGSDPNWVDNIAAIAVDLWLGRGDAYFEGHLFQPIFFDRTLSAAEAEEIYDSGITGAD